MKNQPSMGDQFLTIINQIIEDNIDNENFSVEDLAQKAGLSRSMLHRKLKKLTGKSASDHITELRLTHAKNLLENDVATVSEIAFRVGFSDPSYFNKVFKKHFNVSPGKVRKNLATSLNHLSTDRKPKILSLSNSKAYRLFVKAVVILLVIIIAGGGVYYLFSIIRSSEKSVAVLPLNNLTGQPDNAYFVDGMHDALIGELGQIKSLRVISRTSHDDMHNILKIQTTVIKDIAQKIRIKLSKEEEQLLAKSHTIDPETYKAYLRGMYYLNQGTDESFERGINYLVMAIERDPGDPFAYAGLALGYAIRGHGMIVPEGSFRSATAAANKALKIDPTLDEAYTALALLYLYQSWDWSMAHEAFENAIARNPNNEIAHAHYAFYYVLFGDLEKSIYHAQKSVEINPFSASYHSWLAWLYYYNKEYDKAEFSARKSLELKDNIPYGNLVLGWTYLHKKQYQQAIKIHEKLPKNDYYFKMLLGCTYVQAGNREKALAMWSEMEEYSEKNWVNPFYSGMLAGALGFTDKAFELLNEACDNRYYPTLYIDIFPGAEFIRNDPRYNKLLQKLNLPYNNTLLTSQQ